MRTSIYGVHPSFARQPGKAGDPDAYLDTAERWVKIDLGLALGDVKTHAKGDRITHPSGSRRRTTSTPR